jgi:hypothetical protein
VTILSEAGVYDGPTIDGTDTVLSKSLDMRPTLLQTIEETLSGRRPGDAQYQGTGLPDQADVFEFMLEYDLDSQFATTISFLETLRTQGGYHDLALWKKRIYTYTATSGQAVFYLPRPDAFASGYTGHTADSWKATVKVNGVAIAAADTLYPGAVTSGTAVAAGKVAISTVAVTHDEAGTRVALFKFGTARAAGDEITVEYHPLFRVIVSEVSTKPFQIVGREDKVLIMQEAA